MIAVMPSGHDDVAALHKAQVGFVRLSGIQPQDIVYPGAGGIDHRLECARLAFPVALQNGFPMIGMPDQIRASCAGQDVCTAGARIDGIQNDQPGILDPAIGIFEGEPVVRLQRVEPVGRAAAQCGGGRQQLPAAQMVVNEQAQTDQPGWPQFLVIGQHEPHRPDDVRRRPKQDFPLDQRLPDEAEIILFEIAQAAMDQLGAG